MTVSARHPSRTQLALALVAVAVGGLVFALAGDFVIGVGVGAAVFALSRQALKIWRRDAGADGPAEAEREPTGKHI